MKKIEFEAFYGQNLTQIRRDSGPGMAVYGGWRARHGLAPTTNCGFNNGGDTTTRRRGQATPEPRGAKREADSGEAGQAWPGSYIVMGNRPQPMGSSFKFL